jgi:hypothetical protein
LQSRLVLALSQPVQCHGGSCKGVVRVGLKTLDQIRFGLVRMVLPGVTQLPLGGSPSPRSICSWAHKSRAVRFSGSFASAFSKSTSAAGKLAAARSACAVAEKLRRIFHRRGARAARQPTK